MFMSLSPCDGAQLGCSHHFVPISRGSGLFLFIAANAFETYICVSVPVGEIRIAKCRE